MIARVWSALAQPRNLQPYLDHLAENVLPQLRSIDGFVGMLALTRPLTDPKGPQFEVLVTTYWRSREAIHAFAGAEHETAVVADQAAALLASFDRHVRHYDLVLSDFLSVPKAFDA